MSILTLTNISKRYSHKAPYAVNQFSLAIKEKDITVLVGESGSGKTTLLKLIAGLEDPNEGTIDIAGSIMFDQRTNVSAHKRKVGLVFQEYALFPHLTVKQNILFGLDKLSKKEKEERINKYVNIVGLSDYIDRYPHELSGGQQQRVALARALAPEPKILLMDEPFSNLDEILKKQLRNEIKNIIKKLSITAIIVTHDTKDALALADQVVVLKDGQVLQTDNPETIYFKPVDTYVAQLFGEINIFKAKDLKIDSVYEPNVLLGIRPNMLTIHPSSANTIPCTVIDVQFLGSKTDITAKAAFGDLVISLNGTNSVKTGEQIHVAVNPKYICKF